MKVVLDTNVLVSGIFFGGAPVTILEAWQDGRIDLAVSLDILAEYERVGHDLAAKYPGVDPTPFLSLIAIGADVCNCPPLRNQVCEDPDDDKFFACAAATGAKHIISGDSLLLKVASYRGIEIVRPREFLDRYL